MYFKVLLDKGHVFGHFYFGAWTSLTKCFLHYFYEKLWWPNALITSSSKYNWSLKLLFFFNTGNDNLWESWVSTNKTLICKSYIGSIYAKGPISHMAPVLIGTELKLWVLQNRGS